MTVGDRIKKSREKRDISQVDLASSINVSKQTLYKYENNIITNIPSDKIELIGKELNCSAAYLMGWEENLTRESASIHVKLLSDKELLGYVSVLLDMPEEKKKRVYGYIDSLKEQRD